MGIVSVLYFVGSCLFFLFSDFIYNFSFIFVMFF
eukprot:UN17188